MRGTTLWFDGLLSPLEHTYLSRIRRARDAITLCRVAKDAPQTHAAHRDGHSVASQQRARAAAGKSTDRPQAGGA